MTSPATHFAALEALYAGFAVERDVLYRSVTVNGDFTSDAEGASERAQVARMDGVLADARQAIDALRGHFDTPLLHRESS